MLFHTYIEVIEMHIAKYNRVAVGNIFNHMIDSKARAKRSNVDNDKTKYNYNILNSEKKPMQILKELLKKDNIHCSPRKDVIVATSICLTAPDNLPEDRYDEFFYKAALFFYDRYNKDDKYSPCLGAFVHKDEMAKNKNGNVKPHMHYLMSNLVFDQKKNRYKFCCKEVINKKDLTTLHQDFKNYIDKAMNLKLEIINGATANGNKTILKLKNQELENKVAHQQEEIEKLKQLKNKLQNQIEYELVR